ncbi:uncharacterized protein LOC126457453 [Schistocerca serialis cubense]|uniref:uncharacterized protein LOC126457453 n=1 Tax=Schistocerca serialis cubense TaxID=2023355 RepID=UPI00214F0D05|nr:uncharacterized protein LOC126457453 [Schistocerca serialis cubense]XP_049949694.1 uncharacterized protein LOC126457453 [Schistocerca serialis cubense]XP_049949695.1 uncharacterized protein LOC126457453 [Schistocerca serialis cubense]XP_049949696.1 uncharacterized protein LOC126457453 [Schistocerca serialis cubense]XP_049949698.1 uncharacterized protein LOC126457453 [Schistocerca serialis cubense]XP_049949699.1 uncharacterized protein LOC126457453 [Schistocerca serialis cubense]
MASCRGVVCKGNVSPRTLIRNPLATEDTRERLRQFFEDCSLDSALDELAFWEMCTDVVAKSDNFSNGWLSRLRGAGYRRRDLMRDVKELVRFAQDHALNFDTGQLDDLEQAANSARLPETVKVVESSRRHVEVLLEPKLEAFRKEMRRQHNMT